MIMPVRAGLGVLIGGRIEQRIADLQASRPTPETRSPEQRTALAQQHMLEAQAARDGTGTPAGLDLICSRGVG
jgi:hypothetical protein